MGGDRRAMARLETKSLLRLRGGQIHTGVRLKGNGGRARDAEWQDHTTLSSLHSHSPHSSSPPTHTCLHCCIALSTAAGLGPLEEAPWPFCRVSPRILSLARPRTSEMR